MSETTTLDANIRAIVRDVVREEIRVALHDYQRGHRNAAPANGEGSYLSIAHAASIADVAPGTLRRWIKSGRLPVRRAGRVYRIPRGALDEFLRTGRTHELTTKARAILNDGD